MAMLLSLLPCADILIRSVAAAAVVPDRSGIVSPSNNTAFSGNASSISGLVVAHRPLNDALWKRAGAGLFGRQVIFGRGYVMSERHRPD